MGCTCFAWETKDHKHLLGRTYDQCGSLLGNRIAVIPRNYPLKLEIDKNCPRRVRSRYAFGGMAITGLVSPVMVDGINEMGVMGGLLNYPGYAAYDQVRDSRHMNIHLHITRISYGLSLKPVCVCGGSGFHPSFSQPDRRAYLWTENGCPLYFFRQNRGDDYY